MKYCLFVFVFVFIVGLTLADRAILAQGGMSKATAKLLVTDLIEAGFAPQIRESGGVYFVTVGAELQVAGTAGQVQNFATARGVTAKVLLVQFE